MKHSRFWMTYWEQDTWRYNEEQEGELFRHTAGDNFSRRGVSVGDVVYLVSISNGTLLLGGRMTVGRMLEHEQAIEEYGDQNLYEAKEHLFATDRKSTPLTFHRKVPPRIARELRFVSKTSPMLKFDSPTTLNNQTVRSVRELTKKSAIRLDHFM